MIVFKVNNDTSLICESFSNYKNWGHKITCQYLGNNVETIKVLYQNRTWEIYIFETAMYLMVDKLDSHKTIPLKDRLAMYKMIKNHD